MLEINKNKIKCQIFSGKETAIQELNHEIWRENLSLGELRQKAQSLWVELKFLSSCPRYDQKDIKCKMCRAICELRKQTANNILYYAN